MYEIINIVIPNPKIFLCIPASAAAVNHNGIKILLANSLNLFFNKGKPVFSKGRRSLPKNPPDCTILDSSVFDNFKLADSLFAKALWNLETCLSVNNKSCGTFVLSLESPIIFDERFKSYFRVTFIPDSNLLSFELDNFTFRLLYWVISYWYCIRAKKKIHSIFTAPWEKSKMISRFQISSFDLDFQ